MLFEKEISTNSKLLLSKIGKHIKYLKKSTNEISKLNEIFLERSSNNESNIQINNLHNIIDNKSKYKLSTNFSYINNNYRKQFNNAFLRFNPITYMNHLKILEKANPLIKKDIDDLKKILIKK